jgi:hypothetical protein
MKHFMIKYQFANGTPEEWHREIARFIAAVDSDPELKGKIGYRVMKNRDDTSYFHLAAGAGVFQALYGEDETGRRRRGHGDADRSDRGNGGVIKAERSFFPSPLGGEG